MDLRDAKWIWCSEAREKNAYIHFFSTFSKSDTGEVLLQISAAGQYTVRVNGKMAAWGQYPDYPAHKVYQTHAITKYCLEGKNELLITVYYQGEDTLTHRKEQPGLLFLVAQGEHVLCGSSGKTLCVPDEQYQSGEMEKISPQLGFGFCFRRNKKAFSIEGCKQAQEVNKEANLVQRAVPPLQVKTDSVSVLQSQGVFWEKESGEKTTPGWTAQYAALGFLEAEDMTDALLPVRFPSADGVYFVNKKSDADGVYLLLDCETEQSGFLKLDMELPEGTRVLIAFGEQLTDLRVRSYIDGRSFCVTYIAAQGRNDFVHWFQRLSGRYLQLYLYTDWVKLYDARLLPVEYPIEEPAAFHCSDHLHNKIYQTSLDTLQNCMHEHYEDCPWREQALYAMDGRSEMLCGYYALGAYEYARENLRLLALSQREDGLLEISAPGKEGITIPSFSLAFVLALAEYLLYSGDFAFTRQMLPVAQKIVDSMQARRKPNGLVPNFTEPAYWNFYEWQEGLDGGVIQRREPIAETFDAPLNALLSYALQSLSDIYGWLGQKSRQQECSLRQNRLNEAMEQFYDEEKGLYASYRKEGEGYHYAELTQALCLLCNACPENRRAKLLDRLVSHTLYPVTLGLSIFKYEALLLGDRQKYGRAVFDEIAEKWGNMLFSGATTFWETQEGEAAFHRAGSLCHGWSAIPIYFYFAYGLGVKPVKPGFATYEFQPTEAGLGSIEAGLQTPNGRLTGKDGVITKS